MYAAIRQGKARAGVAAEVAVRIKEGAIPIISDVPGFQAYYVIYAPDDTVTAISIFDNVEAAEEFEPARARLDRAECRAAARRSRNGSGWAGDRAHLRVADHRLARRARRVREPAFCCLPALRAMRIIRARRAKISSRSYRLSIRVRKLGPHEALDLALRPRERFLHGFALHVPDDHLSLDTLLIDLLRNPGRRRSSCNR